MVLSKFINLSRQEIFALFISVCFLIRSEFEIRVLKSAAILKKLQNLTPSAKPSFYLSPLEKLRRTRIISLLEAADRNLGWKPSCLRRTLALASISCRQGLTPLFKVGVRTQENMLRAHSWLEIDGIRLEMDEEAAAYSVLAPTEP